MGHGDALCMTDAGLPIPTGVLRIDLAFAPGQSLDVLDAVTLRASRRALHDGQESSPEIVDALRMRLRQAKESSVTHEELKRLSADAKAVVRTGEFGPFANVILYSGVDLTPE
jgi:D-ribose pyranase